MQPWYKNASLAEHDDAMECGFYDLHLTALPTTDLSDRMGNGLLFLATYECSIALWYEE